MILNKYEELEDIAAQNNVQIVNYRLSERIKGLYCDHVIALNENLECNPEKACVLAEELGHYHTTTGNIIDQSDTANRKQELRARMWAYDKLVSLNDLIKAHNHGCQSRFEIAEYLEVTEEFLQDALLRYEAKYGSGVLVGEYFLSFSQGLMIYKILK